MKATVKKSKDYSAPVEHLKFAIVSTDIVLLRNNNGVIEFGTQIVNLPPHYDGVEGLL